MEQPSNLAFEGKDSVCILLWQPLSLGGRQKASNNIQFYKGLELFNIKNFAILSVGLQHFNNQQKFIFHFWDILGCKKFALGFYKKYFCLCQMGVT